VVADYSAFAPYYDQVGLSAFAQRMTPRLLNFAQQNEWLGRRILDVGCGTGASALFFASNGYAVTGIDQSAEMLEQARQNLRAQSLNATLLNQNLLEIENVDAPDMVLALDVLNELETIRDLEAAFKVVFQLLPNNRLFIFDLHTIEGLARESLTTTQNVRNGANLVAYRQSDFDFERQAHTIEYDVFAPTDDGHWIRTQFERVLKAYPLQAVVSLLRRQNFEVISIVNDQLSQVSPANFDAARVIFVARK